MRGTARGRHVQEERPLTRKRLRQGEGLVQKEEKLRKLSRKESSSSPSPSKGHQRRKVKPEVTSVSPQFTRERPTSASQATMSRWQPPPVAFERKSVFCMTKAEAIEVYNLNSSGQDPRSISEEVFSNEDWLQVFTEVPKRGSKVKCKTVKKNFWPEFYTSFTSVYQEPPGNYGMEVTKAFARGFLYEHLRGPVNWAAFSESIVAHMESGKLQMKKQRWAAFHSPGAQSSRRMPMVMDVDDWDAKKGTMKMHIGTTPVHNLDDIVALVAAKHDKVLYELNQVAMKAEDQKAKLHRNEGAMGLILSLTKQIAAARDRLQDLESVNADSSHVELQRTRVVTLEITLETLRSEVEYVDSDDAVQREFDRKESKAKLIGAQVDFVRYMQTKKSRVLLQVPVPKVPTGEASVHGLDRSCIACGVPMFDDEALGVFMLPCQHEYHTFCFAHVAGKQDTCIAPGCSQEISQRIRSLMLIDSDDMGIKIGKSTLLFCLS